MVRHDDYEGGARSKRADEEFQILLGKNFSNFLNQV